MPRLRRANRLVVNPDVAAAGSSATDATKVREGFTEVSGADGTKGVILTNVNPGALFVIKGVTSGVLKVYPPTGATINALSASAAISLASGLIPVIFVAKTKAKIYTIPLLPS